MIFHFSKKIQKLFLNRCSSIKDFSYIKYLEKLETLYLRHANIFDISFLIKNKKIKKINLEDSYNINNLSALKELKRINKNIKIYISSIYGENFE